MPLNIFEYMSSLRSDNKGIGITEIRFQGGNEHSLESILKVVDFDKDWICVQTSVHGPMALKFININSIASCVIIDFSRRPNRVSVDFSDKS